MGKGKPCSLPFKALICCDAYLLGRPVLSIGTALRASKSCASVMAAKALIPARNNSLFLTGCFKSAARSFKLSRMRYSGFGIVKLSRTNLIFLAFIGFSVNFFATGKGVIFVTPVLR